MQGFIAVIFVMVFYLAYRLGEISKKLDALSRPIKRGGTDKTD